MPLLLLTKNLVVMLAKIRFRTVYNYANRLNADGRSQVAIEARQGPSKAYFRTNVLLYPNQWERGRVVNHENANRLTVFLVKRMNAIEDIELSQLLTGHQMTLSQLKVAVRSGVRASATLDEFVKSVIDESSRSPQTKAAYHTLVREVDKYDKGVTISTINHDWIERWRNHQRRQGLSENTVKGRLKQMHCLCEEAKKRDIISDDPFRWITIGNMKAKAVWCSMSEIRRIERVRLSPKYSRVRDLWLLGCYSGLRWGDLTTLEEAEIKNGMLTKTMYKTKHKVQIPISTLFWGKGMEILERYPDIRKLSHCVSCNSTANKIIKEIAKLAGVKKNISFHVARKSAASNLSLLGMSLQEISKVLGHQRSSTTDNYYLFSKTESLLKSARKIFKTQT